MQTKSGPGDFLAVQMAAMTRLIVHLDERNCIDAQAFLSELLQLGRALPAGQAAAQDLLCRTLQAQLESSRARRQPSKPDTH